MLRSQIPYLTRCKVDVVRRTKTMAGGRIVEGDAVSLYESIPANVDQFRETEVASLGKPSGFGMVSDNQFRVGLGGNQIPNKVQSGDYVRLYWGTPPNVVVPRGIPNGFPPQIMLKDSELQLLTWQSFTNGWVGDTYSIRWNSTAWVLLNEGVEVATFGTNQQFPQISCSSFPDGLTFVRFTGPPMDLKITQVRHKTDNFGNWHHTTLVTEYSETDSGVRI